MSDPRLSVVLPVVDQYPLIARTVQGLAQQTICGQIELVLVATTANALSLERAPITGFHSVNVVRVQTMESAAFANWQGILAATAPIVALAEDHVLHDPEWAEALLKPYADPKIVAVGPALRNANPSTVLSWADFVLGYGKWAAPEQSRAVDFLPGHNSSYRRAVLLEYGDRLYSLLEAETNLHWDLRANGWTLWLAGDAIIAHMNFSRWSSWLPASFYTGQVFAGTRSLQWSPIKRLIYAAASPLIPLVRLRRTVRDWRPAADVSRPGLIWVILCLSFIVSSAGEAVGYLFGLRDAMKRLSHYEFRRVDHVVERDRQAFAAPHTPMEPSP